MLKKWLFKKPDGQTGVKMMMKREQGRACRRIAEGSSAGRQGGLGLVSIAVIY
jgi:hypothetical protein